MFGYIRPYKPEMLIRDFEQYRGVYCGLCKQLGKSYGVAARAALSYDCTFYAIYLMSVASGACCAGFHQSRCVVNPLKKCTYCAEDLPALKMAAALSAIMTYYKIKDDWADGSGLQKLRAVFARPFFSRARKRLPETFPHWSRRLLPPWPSKPKLKNHRMQAWMPARNLRRKCLRNPFSWEHNIFSRAQPCCRVWRNSSGII